MATTQTQLRRGTNAQVNAMTPAEGEVVADLTNDRLCMGDGTRQGGFPIPNFSDCQKNTFSYAVSAGTANALTVSLSPPLLSYVEGVSFSFRATTTNTGSATINVDGLGDIGIRQQDLSVLPAGAITSGRNYELTYNGTYFVITSGVPVATVPVGEYQFINDFTPSGNQVNINNTFITSTYDDYRLIVKGLTTSLANQLRLQLSADNGSTFPAGNYGSTATLNGATFVSATSYALHSGAAGPFLISDLTLDIFRPLSTLTLMDNNGFTYTSGGSATTVRTKGSYSHAAAVNYFRISVVSGTLTGGKVSLYGRKK